MINPEAGKSPLQRVHLDLVGMKGSPHSKHRDQFPVGQTLFQGNHGDSGFRHDSIHIHSTETIFHQPAPAIDCISARDAEAGLRNGSVAD